MQPFKPITAASVEALLPYFPLSGTRVCDFTAGVSYQWRDIYRITYTIADGCACIKLVYPEIGPGYYVPLGAHGKAEAFARIEADAAQTPEEPLRYFCVGEAQLPELRERYGADALTEENMRDWADYLYTADNFRYAGKALHTQRNHVNRFYKEHPLVRCLPVTDGLMPACRALLDRFKAQRANLTIRKADEVETDWAMLQIRDRLRFPAACLFDGEQVLALSVGEIVGDTLYVHVEKADPLVPGAYPAMAQAFAEYARQDALYINREDDAGDEGLRYSKTQYRPVGMVDKYMVTVKA